MLSSVPIIPHLTSDATPAQIASAEQLAEAIRRERPELASDDRFRPLVATSLDDGACLHLDDLSEIKFLQDPEDLVFFQERARLRAGDGDLIATTTSQVAGYESYCAERLGLGHAEWLRPKPTRNPLQIGHACWEDRAVRRSLLHRLRADQLRYLHPHMGTLGVWELGTLLHEHSRRPLSVIAPPPALSQLVNNKVAFAEIAARLLGAHKIPATASAWNLATLCDRISKMAPSTRLIGIKPPDSAGGDAIAVIPAERLQNRSLHDIQDDVRPILEKLGWSGESELLINVWETGVLSSPSIQTWIPPESSGLPVVEGVFVQRLEQDTGVFVGATAANFPRDVTQELATSSWLLARVFQRLGYIGRCSFDTILIGDSEESARIEFIECNGRWGGTSLPMTLINRLFADWIKQPFAVQNIELEGLSEISFSCLLERLDSELYNARTGTGRLILLTPGRLHHQSGITALALGKTWDEAAAYLQNSVTTLLKEAVAGESIAH